MRRLTRWSGTGPVTGERGGYQASGMSRPKASRVIASGSGPPRKYYKITKTGALTLKAQVQDWLAFEAAVKTILGDIS